MLLVKKRFNDRYTVIIKKLNNINCNPSLNINMVNLNFILTRKYSFFFLVLGLCIFKQQIKEILVLTSSGRGNRRVKETSIFFFSKL